LISFNYVWPSPGQRIFTCYADRSEPQFGLEPRVNILCPSDLFIAAFYKVLPIIFEIKINSLK
jgi:hypothetical protein